MSRYCLAMIAKPLDWKPDRPDDVPNELPPEVEIRGEFDDLFPATPHGGGVERKIARRG